MTESKSLKSNIEWKKWGKEDPLWAVSTEPDKQKNGACPWTENEFYAQGESDWRDFVHHWRQYGLNEESCLEIGCGAGRITKQLATTFDQVHAVDVSEEMVICARKAIDGGNVEFSVIEGLRLPQRDGAVDAIFSTHVLQHLDSSDIGLSYFREFFRALNIGGTIMVHLPLYQFPLNKGRVAMLMRWLYAYSRLRGKFQANTKRRLGRESMMATHYPIQTISAFLSDLGFKKIEFRIFSVKSNGNPHSFVFATK